MPTDAAPAAAQPAARHPAAARRILRLAFGTALCLLFSQIIAWPMSFVAPILTLTVLALPLPAPPLKLGLGLIVGLLLPMLGGLAILTVMESARWAGILLISLALYHSFLFTARGGPAALGTFITMGLTVTVTIGTVNPTLLAILVQALGVGAVVGVLFVWVAHAILPDVYSGPRALPKKAPTTPVDPADARRSAFRSLLIVLPVALVFMYMSASAAYTVIMIKVATMGQQASVDDSREMGRSLIASTFWGGVAAFVAWELLRTWPSLTLYVLLVVLAGLLFGRRIFAGPAVHPEFTKWSYAYVTMLIILGPSVLDSPISSGAGSAFWLRLLNFMVIALYGSAAVAVFDAFWPKRSD